MAQRSVPRNDRGVDSDQPSFTDVEYGNRRRIDLRGSGKTLRWGMAFEKPHDDLLVTVSHGLGGDAPVTFE